LVIDSISYYGEINIFVFTHRAYCGIRVMDINNLQAFIEVAEKKSFSKSAETLKLTQPAVSKRIAALEAELSSRLFDRIGRSVHLTEAGKVLLPSALKISSEVSRIEDEIGNLSNVVNGSLNLGSCEHVNADLLAPVLKSFKDSYPGVEIKLQFVTSDEAIEYIENGRLDMSLCSMGDSPSHDSHSRLRSLEIWRDEMCIVCESHHPLAARQGITVQELAEFPAILPSQNTALRKAIDRSMLRHQVEALVCLEAADFQAIRSMANVGLGWALLPESYVGGSLMKINIADLGLYHSVALLRNSDRTMTRAAQAFLDLLPSNIGASVAA